MVRQNRCSHWRIKLAAGVAIMMTLGGCNEYLDRRDSISPVSGDAVRQNMVTHVIDPWPRQAHDRTITLSGQRAVENTAIAKEPPEAPAARASNAINN